MRENGKSGIFISPTLCGVIRGRAAAEGVCREEYWLCK